MAERRDREDVEVQHQRPVLDVVQVAIDAFADLGGIIDFTAPAIDLRPAGDARLDLVAGEISVDDLVPELVARMGVHGMRARAHEREFAAQHVEELRQFVDGSLADEPSDPRDARIVLGNDLPGVRIGHLVIHRAELQHLDDLVVEAVAALAEDDRPLAFQPDGDRRRDHQRRKQKQRERRDHDVEDPLGDCVPVGDRLVENVEEGKRAFVGIGARTETQLVGMRRQANVDWQHPEFLQKLQHPLFRRERQRHDEHVDPRHAAELNQFGHRAELGIAGDDGRRARIVTVVENAADADVAVALRLERADEFLCRRAAAHDDGATLQPSVRHQPAHHEPHPGAICGKHRNAHGEPQAEPHAREFGRGLRQEADHHQHQQRQGEAGDRLGELRDEISQARNLVAVQRLDEAHRQDGPEEGRSCMPEILRAVRGGHEGDYGERHGQQAQEFEYPHQAADHVRRHRVGREELGHLLCQFVEFHLSRFTDLRRRYGLADRLWRKDLRRVAVADIGKHRLHSPSTYKWFVHKGKWLTNAARARPVTRQCGFAALRC